MTVHFIGAGPGDHELLTLKAYKIISRCPICLYAGSLVSEKILDYCPENVRLVDTSKLDLAISDSFDLENLAAAFQHQIDNKHFGKISIDIG